MGFLELLAAADRPIRKVLGGTITYAPSSGVPVDVSGIFDAAYQLADPSVGHTGVASTVPAVFLRLEDLPSDPSADRPTITVNGTEYDVREAHPDGLGGVVLHLREL